MQWLNFFKKFRDLVEIEPGVYGAVHTLHGQGLVGSQGIQIGEVRLGKDDGVETGLAPQLHEVHHIPNRQGGWPVNTTQG
uniref:Uncharacterized protein n=1 Tax=Anguilla anguilla TaxID=7936 RepID=A0A0E9PHY7_ANGAN